MPTEQITITSGLADGSTIEGYVQFSHDRIGLGVSGSTLEVKFSVRARKH